MPYYITLSYIHSLSSYLVLSLHITQPSQSPTAGPSRQPSSQPSKQPTNAPIIGTPGPTPCLTIAEFLENNNSTYSILVGIADLTGLLGALEGDGPLTLFGKKLFFRLSRSRISTLLISCVLISYDHTIYQNKAPTNEAFEDILDDIPQGANLTDILLYHIDAGAIFSSQLFNNLQLTMLNGDDTTITKDETSIKINNSTVISPFDVAACNGVVHTIDKVLIPPTTTSSPSSSPTQQPTYVPSASPSIAPSTSPSKAPSNAPVKGTVPPTQSPSREPSTSPTTRKPSNSPSVSPSSQPSSGQSLVEYGGYYTNEKTKHKMCQF